MERWLPTEVRMHPSRDQQVGGMGGHIDTGGRRVHDSARRARGRRCVGLVKGREAREERVVGQQQCQGRGGTVNISKGNTIFPLSEHHQPAMSMLNRLVSLQSEAHHIAADRDRGFTR